MSEEKLPKLAQAIFRLENAILENSRTVGDIKNTFNLLDGDQDKEEGSPNKSTNPSDYLLSLSFLTDKLISSTESLKNTLYRMRSTLGDITKTIEEMG